MKKNIYHHDDIPASGEIFEILLKHKNVVIEKILSSDILPDKEYNQDHDEWVILLEGSSEIVIDGQPTQLIPGDSLFIKSGLPHRVSKASPGSLWLAIHIY